MNKRKRKVLPVLWIFLFGWIGTNAQSVAIPDSNLLKFLKRNYQRTIFANKLIVSEAAKVNGALYCTGQQIQNAEGIQYFTSINTLDLSRNRLVSLPPILRNDSLRNLILINNQLKTLPDLSLYPNLVHLDVVDNEIISLNGVENLKNLQSLIAKGNMVAIPPIFDSMKALTALDLSYNLLLSFPVLPVSHKIQSIHLNNNHIKTLPNKIILPTRARMWLYKNDLTFRELLKLKAIPGYDTSILNIPQNNVPVTSLTVKEMDTVSISSKADLGVPNMRYRWYKNGALVANTTSPAFVILSANFLDSGNYVCQLTNFQLPSIEIWTDTLEVAVIPCIDLKQFSFTSTHIDCERSGTLQVINPFNERVEYFLKGKVTGQVHHASNGRFTSLTEPVYSLSLVSQKGCRRDFPSEIVIEKEACQKTLVTPNGDGEADSYFFTNTGTVSIYDKNETIVKTLAIPNEWDGTARNGRVAPGIYLADINNGQERINISVVY